MSECLLLGYERTSRGEAGRVTLSDERRADVTPDQLQATPDQASAVSTRPFVSGSSSAAKISMP
jgi:hypothetical protein